MSITREYTVNMTTMRIDFEGSGSYGADGGVTTEELDDAVDAGLASLVASAPATLNTLDELAAALGDDASFASTVTTALAAKQPLDSDLTAIAALSTTSIGRSLLAAADAAALRTIADAQPLDSDLTAIAALTTTSVGRSLLAAADAAAIRTISDAQQLDSDLTAIAALSTASYGRSLLVLANVAALKAEVGTISGTGSPEGVTTAAIGTEFYATDTGRRWVKSTGAGNTGWTALDAHGNITLPTNTYIYVPHNTVSTSIFAANGEIRYTAVYFPHACTIDRVGFEVSTTGDTTSATRVGIFEMNASLKPGTLISDLGTVSTASGTGLKTVSGTVVIPRAGWYFFAVAQQGAPTTRATVRTATNVGMAPPINTESSSSGANTGAFTSYAGTGVTGAFSSTPSATGGNTDPVKIQYRLVSVP